MLGTGDAEGVAHLLVDVASVYDIIRERWRPKVALLSSPSSMTSTLDVHTRSALAQYATPRAS